MKNDISGQRFGMMVAMCYVGKNTRSQAIWKFKCDCGKEVDALAYNIMKRNKGCGCKRVKHGHRGKYNTSPEYVHWNSMIQRCYTPTNGSYCNYGARGVTVCDRWRESFMAFYEDMGQKPGKDYSLDRIDNELLHYSPENCRWATEHQQQRNRRNVKLNIVDIMQIRWLCSDGDYSQTDVANVFDITSSHISNIVNNKVWTDELE